MRYSSLFRKKKREFGLIAINLIESNEFEQKLDYLSKSFYTQINSEFNDRSQNESLADFLHYINSIKWNFQYLKSELTKHSIKDKWRRPKKVAKKRARRRNKT